VKKARNFPCVREKSFCAAPQKMMYADNYLTNGRVRLSCFALTTG